MMKYRLNEGAAKRSKKRAPLRSLSWVGFDSTGRISRRFMDKVEIPTDSRHCWLWKGAKNAAGYGIASVNGRHVAAHRLAVYLFRHRDPKGLMVMHCCDTPACVNPRHLSLGTAHDNVRDMEVGERLRRIHCERHGIEFVKRVAVAV